jgi:2-polyprenyl-6-methoxyphenol hydroxylase-like FAD-dependent oxidoreductase
VVGDAGYCASPLSGQGTSLAIIGAYILAGELASAKRDYACAFKSYEEVMKPFIAINQTLGQNAANRMNKQGVIGKAIQQVLSYAPGRLIKWIINYSSKQIQRAANSIEIRNYP